MTDENGKSKGFGFVSFEEHEAAQKVIYSAEQDSHQGFLVCVSKNHCLGSCLWKLQQCSLAVKCYGI